MEKVIIPKKRDRTSAEIIGLNGRLKLATSNQNAKSATRVLIKASKYAGFRCFITG